MKSSRRWALLWTWPVLIPAAGFRYVTLSRAPRLVRGPNSPALMFPLGDVCQAGGVDIVECGMASANDPLFRHGTTTGLSP